MKSKDDQKQKNFEEDYYKIINHFLKQDTPVSQNPQWVNPGDYIVKFSLYQEKPNSITSTDTLVNL